MALFFYLNLAGRNGSFSCCLLTNLPRATLQVARKVMCLWHRAKPASVSVDRDFSSDMFHMFHVLKSNDLFCESYIFFSVPCVIKSALCKALSEKKNLACRIDSVEPVRILMWDTANIYCSKSELFHWLVQLEDCSSCRIEPLPKKHLLIHTE